MSETSVTEQELASKAVAPRVTADDIAGNIVSEHYFTAAEGVKGEGYSPRDGFPDVPEVLHLLTFCVLVLKNGFTVTGESACASAANFNPEIGRRLAREHAVNKIWPLMGYELRERLHRKAQALARGSSPLRSDNT
jgi:hypothetical protein